MAPEFDHYANIPNFSHQGLDCYLFMGDFLGHSAPVKKHAPLMGLDIKSKAGTTVTLPLTREFEYGFMTIQGGLTIDGQSYGENDFVILDAGSNELTITFHENSHIVMVGGTPMNEPLIIWWNFVARTQAEIEQAREDWINAHERFGTVDHPEERLGIPEITANLKATQNRGA